MGEFLIKPIGSSRLHSYPESRGAGPLAVFGGNFASGPVGSTVDVPIAGVQVPWSAVGSGAPGVNVPITPRSTGLIRIMGVIVVKNADGAQHNVEVQIQVNGVALPVPLQNAATVSPDLGTPGSESIPFLVDTPMTVGVTSNVSILVASDIDPPGITLGQESCAIEIQEIPLPTG